jgi:ketosteroid isomerase-like protein
MDLLTHAFEREDVDLVRQLLSPDARVRRNNGEERGVDLLIATISGLEDAEVAVKYSDVRRVIGDDAVAEQHLVTLIKPDGTSASSEACLVARFDETGLVTRLDEYIDSSALAGLAE